MSNSKVKIITGEECANFRKYTMGISLIELSNITGINYKTLSGFENGRSSNLRLLYIYLTYLSDKHKSELIDRIIERVENENGN